MRYLIFLLFLLLATLHSKDPLKNPAGTSTMPLQDSSFYVDSMMAAVLFHQADSELFYLQYDSAAIHFGKSADLYERWLDFTDDSVIWASCATAYLNTAEAYFKNQQKDTSILFYNKCLLHAKKRFGNEHPIIAVCYFRISRYHFYKNDSKGRDFAFTSFKISSKIFKEDNILLALTYLDMAYQYFLMDDREKMEIYYNKAEEIFEHLYIAEDFRRISTDTISNREPWGSLFPNSLHVDLNLNYIDYHLRTSYNNLILERLDNARFNFNKAIQCFKAHSYVQSRMYFRIKHIEAHLLIFSHRYNEALALADTLISLMDHAIHTYTFIDAYETKTLAFEKSKQFEKAFQCMKTCFGIYTPNGDQGIILYKYFRLAELALNSDRKDLSLTYVDSAIQILIPEAKDPEILDLKWNNFNPGVLKNLLMGLKYKFLASYDQIIEGLDLYKMRELEQLVNIIHEGNVYLHYRIYSDFNRLTREAENFPIYERAIQLNNRLFQLTGEKEYALKGLKWSEACKNVILARELAGINKLDQNGKTGTIEQLKAVNQKIREVKFNLTELNNRDTSQDSKARLHLQGQLAGFYGELEFLKEKHAKELDSAEVSDIKNDYPIHAIREKLKKEDGVLIDYFYGDGLISIHLVTRDTLITRLFPKTADFDQSLIQFVEILKRPGSGTQEKLHSSGKQLYQKLIEPLTPFLRGKNIVVIPDGLLSFLPFEYLLQVGLSLRSVHYEYSSSLYLQLSKKNRNMRYVGFAPEYTGSESINQTRSDSILLEGLYSINRGKLGRLEFNIPEVVESSKILDGHSFTGKNISKSVFFSNVRKAGIIHLALHAMANDQNPDYSQFLLNSDANENANEPLYSYQIKELDLNAELAILSACNTGAGKYQHGNGVESLAKAFKQAGCNNILMSLWPVNDLSTKEIVVGFIRNLKEGMGKAEALNNAKKDYLAMAPEEMKHPYYWAGLVLIGDNEPMFGMGSWGLKGLVLIASFLSLITLMTLLSFKYS